ncbi:MAG: ABC transporter ATP-binding protein [Tissierellia bacterium]|nr:ABC transporter ATP-binding protein [Tissierellia bacterium]
MKEVHRDHLVTFDQLHTSFHTDKGVVHAVNGVSFHLDAGETVALVGESGSGKSVTALSLLGLLPKPQGKIESGHIYFDGTDVLSLTEDQHRALRGRDMSIIFQEPMTSLNPSLKIGFQLREVYQKILGLSKKEAVERSIDMLRAVEMPDPEGKMAAFPHELSGGQRQRVMIAIALAARPRLLIADEPTTALDVTIQAEVLDLMKRLKEEYGTAILLITHDLGVVAEMADRVVVMYHGQIVEKADVFTLFDRPKHPYTQGLLKARPTLENVDEKLYSIEGNVPPATEEMDHCAFAARCERAMDICWKEDPGEERVGESLVRCHLYGKGERS